VNKYLIDNGWSYDEMTDRYFARFNSEYNNRIAPGREGLEMHISLGSTNYTVVIEAMTYHEQIVDFSVNAELEDMEDELPKLCRSLISAWEEFNLRLGWENE